MQQDAVLSYTEKRPRLNADAQPITRWDGHTTKPHPVTGLEVPDEAAQTPVYDYINPKPAEWPQADFIVGNPPFIGAKYIREALGDGYAEALRNAYKDNVQESADFVMFWWYKAAKLLSEDKTESFGFITTNSIWQTFNRRVIEMYLDSKTPISITLAIPNHPWVNSADGANVEIAMTVARKGERLGRVLTVVSEEKTNGVEVDVIFSEKSGKIHSDLTIGAATTSAIPLKANDKICSRGVQLIGAGFIIDKLTAENFGYGKSNSLNAVIREYRNGKDFTSIPREVFVIDFYGLNVNDVRSRFPEMYQWIYERVKQERESKSHTPDGAAYAKQWWLFGKTRGELRKALEGLNRYVTTVATAKHRVFQFYDIAILPDDALINIASDNAFELGVLSSKIHIYWSLATGGDLGGNTPRYNNSRCFQTFPFPEATEEQKQNIRIIAEQLDAHRKQRQALHPTLTITDMYNVLEKLRSGDALNAKEQTIHQQGLVSILLQYHNELDAAVATAYGWPANLTEEEILEKLVALNKERAAEEARGLIRWLRPEYQNPQGTQQTALNVTTTDTTATVTELSDWPKNLAEQAQAVQKIIQQYQHPVSAGDIGKQFKKVPKPAGIAREQQIGLLLETISTLGLLRKTEEGLFVR